MLYSLLIKFYSLKKLVIVYEIYGWGSERELINPCHNIR